MLVPVRLRLPSLLTLTHPHSQILLRLASTKVRTSDRVATNDPIPPKAIPNVSESNAVPVNASGVRDGAVQELPEEAEEMRQLQAPNRSEVWSRSQNPRARAMTGPRFEQTIMEYQPQPYAAIELIHKQPVRWTDKRVVECDGGGGPLGHPRIFVNLDKPQINFCTYCGLPFANNHHRKHLESLPSTTYPLMPTSDPANVNEQQRVADDTYSQR